MRYSPSDTAVPQSTAAREPAALMLDGTGTIRDCNDTVVALFGFERDQLIAHHVSRLLPQLTDAQWLFEGHPNPRLRYLFHIGCQFEAITCDGRRFGSRLFLIDLDNGMQPRLRLIIRIVDDL